MAVEAMGVTVDRLVKYDGEGSLRAYCDITLANAFLIKGLRVIEGKNGLFVSMPRQQAKDGRWFDNVRPLSKTVKEEIDEVVLDAYRREVAAAA
jgi:stage V sporulation protein G